MPGTNGNKRLPTQFRFQVFDFDFNLDIPMWGTNTLEEAVELAGDVNNGKITERSGKNWRIKDGTVKRQK